LPVGAENAARAVEAQERDSRSLLHHTRAMIALRRMHPALRHGAVTNCSARADLLVLERACEGERLRLLANFGEDTIMLDQEAAGETLCALNGAAGRSLPPYGALLVRA
jgi:alpha-glucosidase